MNPHPHPLQSWMVRLVSRRSSLPPPSSLAQSRTEVCPPELWPSSLSLRSRFARFSQRLRSQAAPWWPVDERPINRLAIVKAEFQDSVCDLVHAGAPLLQDKIDRARSLRELWHLRSSVYGEVATALDQSEAERRLARLNRHFPMRAPRSGPGAVAP